MNLQQTPPEPYFSCPHCLTKIETIIEKTKETSVEETLLKTKHDESKEKNMDNDNKAECNYHLGYLGERTQKEPIPDDCLVCKDILECMVKKTK